MLTLGRPADAKRLRNQLVKTFKDREDGPRTRRLTTPGGAVEGARIHWVDLGGGAGIWAHFWKPPEEGDTRWGCWFGTTLGDTGSESLVPAVEINLPVTAQLTAAGRVLLDEDGRLYLGHRGSLGGGRGGQVSMEDFGRAIRGFVREEFEVPGRKRPEKAFVIAAADAADLVPRLHAYVSECVRLREEKRSGADVSLSPDGDDGTPGSFTEEYGEDGTGAGTEERDITRLHARVVNALAKLVPGATNSSWDDMRPDLYVVCGGAMEMLFEVKASSDTQSWFTAIGQLVVYSGSGDPPPRRVFVCPADRKHPAFRKALEHLDIRLVTFEVDARGRIRFSGLERALPQG
jgi:hypothetical protein